MPRPLTERGKRFVGDLPWIVANDQSLEAVLHCAAREHDRLDEYLTWLHLQAAPATATLDGHPFGGAVGGIRLWELTCNLPPDVAMTEEQARGRLLDWIRNLNTLGNEDELRAAAARIHPGTVIEHHSEGFFDAFLTDTLTDRYAFDAGAGTIAAAGNRLVPSSTAEKRFYRLGYRPADRDATVKLTVGTDRTTDVGRVLKRIDATNALTARLSGNASACAMEIRKLVAGTFTTLATGALPGALAAATSYWLRARIVGNVVTAEFWVTDPVLGGTPTTTVSHTLAGGNATQFGAGVAGDVGLRLVPGDTLWRYDDDSVVGDAGPAANTLRFIVPDPPDVALFDELERRFDVIVAAWVAVEVVSAGGSTWDDSEWDTETWSGT